MSGGESNDDGWVDVKKPAKSKTKTAAAAGGGATRGGKPGAAMRGVTPRGRGGLGVSHVPCRFYSTPSGCANGKLCPFSHGSVASANSGADGDGDDGAASTATAASSAKPAPVWVRGRGGLNVAAGRGNGAGRGGGGGSDAKSKPRVAPGYREHGSVAGWKYAPVEPVDVRDSAAPMTVAAPTASASGAASAAVASTTAAPPLAANKSGGSATVPATAASGTATAAVRQQATKAKPAKSIPASESPAPAAAPTAVAPSADKPAASASPNGSASSGGISRRRDLELTAVLDDYMAKPLIRIVIGYAGYTLLASFTKDEIELWDAQSFVKLNTFGADPTRQQFAITGVAGVAGTRQLAICRCTDSNRADATTDVTLWDVDVNQQKMASKLPIHDLPIQVLNGADDFPIVASLFPAPQLHIQLWNVRDNAGSGVLRGHKWRVRALAIPRVTANSTYNNADGVEGLLCSLGVEGSGACEIILWDWRQLKLLSQFEVIGRRFNTLAMINESLVAIGSGPGAIWLFNIRTKQMVCKHSGMDPLNALCALSGTQLASSAPGEVRIWRIHTAKKTAVSDGKAVTTSTTSLILESSLASDSMLPASSMALLNDNMLAIGHHNGTIQIYDFTTHKLVVELPKTRPASGFCVFSI